MSPGEPTMPLWWCLIYPWWFYNMQWLRRAGLYERCKLALELKRLKTPGLKRSRKEGFVQKNISTGRPQVENNTVRLFASLLDADRRWTTRELAAEVLSMSQNFVPHSARHSGSPRVGYPMKFPRCNNGTAMQSHRLCWTDTKRKMTFLDESSLRTKPEIAHTNL